MSYYFNKMNRRKTKYDNILWKDYEIKTTDSPTEIIVICNGGLCNGITYDMVWKTFEEYGNLENIVMIPGKSYCFLEYNDRNSAIKALSSLHGKLVWKEIKGPLYLGSVKNIPSTLLKYNPVFQKPPGLIVLENFVSLEEEQMMLALVGFNENDENSSELKYRKVKHFGYEFKYGSNNVDLDNPIDKIPIELSFLWERLQKYLEDRSYSNFDFVPDQLTVNCYEPGQGIPAHVDTHSAFENVIVSLSLQSSVVMEFKNYTGNCYSVNLPRRSICLMTGESRYDWTHAITPRKSDVIVNPNGNITLQKREKRTSLTFRMTRIGDCTCQYPRLCDSKLHNAQTSVDKFLNLSVNFDTKTASELEGNFVHGVYEKIASHFNETRHKPWPNVLKFVHSFEVGSVIVDVGCGNGKYFSNQNSHFELGCDYSTNLLKLCKDKGFECFSCNCLYIPIRDNVVDGCICIAVIHHLTSKDRRCKAIKEIIRVLRNQGKALIYVWAKNQEKNNEKSSYIKQCNRKKINNKNNNEFQIIPLDDSQKKIVLPVHTNRTNFNYNDLLVPWKLKKNFSNSESNVQEPVYLRFYHVYEDNELIEMCQELDDVNVIDYYYDQGNWCIVLQKK